MEDAVPSGPLRDIRVVDLSEGVTGPFCTKLLADYGADVVKVERPGGDPARRMGPFAEAPARDDAGGLFLHLNTNKRSIVVDLDQPRGAAVVRDLLVGADVLVETGRPGGLAAAGLAPDDLLEEQPALVVSSITPFGQTGPYRDYQMTEIVAFAMGGPMNSSGNPAREPVKLAGHAVLMQSGATAATATLGALYLALERGIGQHVDVATFETQNGSLDRRRYYLLSYAYSGTTTQRVSTVGRADSLIAGGRFEAADSRLITTGRIWPAHLPRMVAVLGDERIAALHAEKGAAIMTEDAIELNAAIGRWAAGRPARAAMREAQAAGWPVVVVNDPHTLLTDEHFVARGFWATAAGDGLPYCGPPWRIGGDGWSLRRPAPRLGEDTDAVLGHWAGYDGDRIAALRAEGVVA